MKLLDEGVNELENELDVRVDAINESRVTLFMSLMASGVKFPPVEYYRRENKKYLKDGRGRLEATKRLGKKTISAVEVPYTSRPEMRVAALKANLTEKGVPFPPTERDYRLVIQGLERDGIAKKDAIRMLEEINVPSTFASKLVREVFHGIRKLSELHAVEAIRHGRMSIHEAASHFDVSVETIHRKLDAMGAYGIPQFALDIDKKLKTFQKFVSTKLNILENSGGTRYFEDAVLSVRKQTDEFSRWIEAQRVARS